MKPLAWLAVVAAAGLAVVAATPALAQAGDLIAFVSIRSGDPHIHLIRDGVDRPVTTEKGVHTSPALSPDGRLAYLKSVGGLPRVFVTDVGGTNPRQLGSSDRFGFAPSWSPDGRTLAYYSADPSRPGAELHLVDVERGATTVVAADGRDKGPQAASWANDGRSLAFLGEDEKGQRQAFVVQRDGSGLKDVSKAFSPRHKAAPQISPDGRQVVFIADARQRRPIVAVDLATGLLTELTPEPDAAYEMARWSPDGKQLAVVRAAERTQADTRNDIFVLQADGSGARNVSRHPAEDFDPHWSGDGRSIVFASLRGGTSQLYRVDLINGRTEPVSRGHRSHDMDHVVRSLPH